MNEPGGSPPAVSLEPRAVVATIPAITAVAAWSLLAALWLLSVGARFGGAVSLARVIFPLALAATGGWAFLWLRTHVRTRQWLIPTLLALSLVVRLIGADHEVSGRYWGDEGTYYQHATQINEGKLLTRSFVYPHLTYDLYAFVLWLAGLFPSATAGAVRALWGVTEPLEREWLILRLVAALLGAFTVVPVALLARRIASKAASRLNLGTLAGAFAGLLLIANPHFNMGSHLFICDAPSAFFAAVSLAFAGRLLDAEKNRDYVAAGIWAGLAAAAKYPAGVVAVAIVALWASWRFAQYRLPQGLVSWVPQRLAAAEGARRSEEAHETNTRPGAKPRRWSWGLLWAGLAAISAFVAVMPSLAVYPDIALFGQRGMLFGARQYALHGWIGVTPHSNAAFYLQLLVESFGPATLVIGLPGLFALDRPTRGRWLRMAVFPALFLGLLFSMAMVVKRNLYPAMPPLAALLGVGLAAAAVWALGRIAEKKPRLRFAVVPLLAALCLAPPAWRTTIETIGYARASTRELAAAWVYANLPPGARIVKEQYTPNFPDGTFEIVPTRFAGRLAEPEMREAGNDYLLLASDAYKRFLDPELLTKEHHKGIAQNYSTILASYPKIGEWIPNRIRLGPIVQLYRLEPLPADCRTGGPISARDAHVPDLRMRTGPNVAYQLPGQWVLFKGCFAAGKYSFHLDGTIAGPGSLRGVDAANRKVADTPLGGEPVAVDLPSQGKYFFYVSLPEGSRLRGVVLEPAG
ncbi:MAG: glycosyltransferase family 39 protein [Acidobacteriota bacterium]